MILKHSRKHKILLIFTLIFIGINKKAIYSQSLEGAEWLACNVYEDTTYLNFANNMVYFKSPNTEGFEDFVPVSSYSTIEDTLIWNDLEEPDQCNPIIIGRYIYDIDMDTLTFEELEDECDFRLEVLSELILKREVTVDVSNLLPGKINIYPNPVKDEVLTIDSAGDSEYYYRIFNNLGILVKEGPGESIETLDVSSLARGNYFIRITTGNNKNSTIFKIIKI